MDGALEGTIKSASTCTGTSVKNITSLSQTRAGNSDQKGLWRTTMFSFTDTNIPNRNVTSK